MCLILMATLSLSVCANNKPNIILILADDLGYSDLGCYGGEMNTLNIDSLAAGGVRFTQLYNSARCCPSRASLMTGLYPTQAGIGDFTTRNPSPTRGPGYLGRLNDKCATIAEVLKPAGYANYYVGKWHLHPETGPIKRGFDEFYGYTTGHSHDQYDADYYIRLPKGRTKEIAPSSGAFYATDVFNDYAIEFINQGQNSGKPWFLFLGHSSPHFPIQAPAERADKYEPTYLRGWDVLREERLERMREIGLVDGDHWQLSPRSVVPVDRNDIANGYAGKENPAWVSLEEERKKDLARRMSVFAAMVEGVDKGVGQIVEHLKRTDDFDNTLILFLSDNGACYEWGPFGFDGASRKGNNTLRSGKQLREIGGPGTHQSYGSAWSNLGNTPFKLYKHFTHEGGISTPFIVHWPKGIGHPNQWIREPAHVMDVMPTLIEAASARYPSKLGDRALTSLEGMSLLPAIKGKGLPDRIIGFDHQAAHAVRDGNWKAVYSKRMPHKLKWELYNLAEDRCEINDLSERHPIRLQNLISKWDKWARRVGVIWEPNQISEAADQFPKEAFIEVPTDRKPDSVMDGQIIRQGLKSHDKALYIKAGWIRDPYITIGPDDAYYLTGTQPREGDPREARNPYNIGLGDESIVGDQVRVWRSSDLVEWESLGPIFSVDETIKAKRGATIQNRYIWAPEIHWLSDIGDHGCWALVHCPRKHSSLALTEGTELTGPWRHPMNGNMGQRHDPSIFTDDDGTRYLLWGNTMVAPLKKDLSGYSAEPIRIDPSGSRPGPNGKPINRIGHEGATMIKVGGKYVHFGTAWSTDQGRKGSYNLYYCVADKITGPYGPRKFAGRFLGHGTPFKDKAGKWWCTAFFNANVPPLSRDGIQKRDLGDNAQTINEQGVTIVPLDVRVLENGEVFIRANDPAYASPGPDEAQRF